MNNIFYVKGTFNYSDGMLKTDVRLFPRTIKQYPFFQGKTGLESFRESKRAIEMELAISPDDPYKEHEQRFADIHSVTEFSPVACYMIISQRFKDLLSTFNICAYRFDLINLHGLGEVRPYYLFHIPRPFDALDYEKSVFGVINKSGPEKGFVELFTSGFIKNYEHLKVFKSNYLEEYNKSPETYYMPLLNCTNSVRRNIACRKAIFKGPYDIIAPIEGFGILVNEKVKKAIKNSNLVGCDFEPYPHHGAKQVFFEIEIPEIV